MSRIDVVRDELGEILGMISYTPQCRKGLEGPFNDLYAPTIEEVAQRVRKVDLMLSAMENEVTEQDLPEAEPGHVFLYHVVTISYSTIPDEILAEDVRILATIRGDICDDDDRRLRNAMHQLWQMEIPIHAMKLLVFALRNADWDENIYLFRTEVALEPKVPLFPGLLHMKYWLSQDREPYRLVYDLRKKTFQAHDIGFQLSPWEVPAVSDYGKPLMDFIEGPEQWYHNGKEYLGIDTETEEAYTKRWLEGDTPDEGAPYGEMETFLQKTLSRRISERVHTVSSSIPSPYFVGHSYCFGVEEAV